MQRFRFVVSVMAALLVTALAACSSSGSPNPRSSASDSATTSPASPRRSATARTSPISPSTSPSGGSSTPADPRVAAALKTYVRFTKAVAYAYMHPPKRTGDPLPSAGNFRQFSFDPAQGQVLNDVFSLTQLQVAYRGTPAVARPSVANVDLTAKPYPTVTLTDCPVPARWKIVATSPGPPPTVQSSPSGAPAPNLTTAKIIMYEKRWGVSTVTTHTSRTCTP